MIDAGRRTHHRDLATIQDGLIVHHAKQLYDLSRRRERLGKSPFSFAKLLRASDSMNWNDAPIEKTRSDELARACGVEPRLVNGAFVDVGLTRDLTQASASGGGELASASAELAAGVPGGSNDFLARCTVVPSPGGAGLQQVGRFDALPAVSVLANEGASIGETTPTTSRSLLNASNAGAYVEHSRQWALQTEFGARALVQLLTNALRTHVGVQIIEGSGASGQVLGLVNDTAVSSASGTTLAWSTVATTLETVEKAAGDGALAWVVTAPAAKLMRQRAIITGGNEILKDGRIGGYPTIVIGGTTAAHAAFGRWRDLIVYEWAPLEIAANPFAAFRQAIIGVRGWVSFNAAPLVNGSFATIKDIT